MKTEIPKTYTAADWESTLYTLWEKSGFLGPDVIDSEERYSNILPPPNANGELHLGHASGYTVMDIFGRYQRMNGKKTLLLPGKDHAGIQTQVVFEKKLKDEQGVTRSDLGREKFYQATYDFCIDRANYMRSQEKRIGLSADWSREKFTLDTEVSKRATETFVQMYTDGMIYRGERIINWCPRCSTALSDIEVEYQTKKEKLYWLQYGPFILATTRPETKLGDTGVAIHPDDTRYKDFVGKKIIIPGVLGDFEITVVADNSVDPTFGSGVIKVTPAHDFTDFDIAKRHHLPLKQIIGTDGRMMSNCGKYAGMTTLECRVAIVADMQDMGLIKKIEDYEHNLSLCERCKTPIEPLISKQWFINVDAPKYSLKKKSVEALKNNAIIFHPESTKEHMIQWLENLHDWCISRQLWWGHRIPVWYRGTETYCGTEAPEGTDWKQDPDTLDTWFSSGQWPYTTLGYPDAPDAKNFYPTDMMVMGRDLLFFWATRMVMFGFYKTHVAPFKHLYFTGLVRDKEDQKMSKSKGNGIDVLQMIDRFGADAVRLSLTLGATPGVDFRLYEEKIETYRNFANKLWNIGRYISQQKIEPEQKLKAVSDADHWIMERLQSVTEEVTRLIESYQLSLAGEKLRDFTWNEFADWYVEIHKVEKNQSVLRFVFETLLKLWHPFMPFVTEALFQSLYKNDGALLMMTPWPKETKKEKQIKTDFQNIIDLIQRIRNFRAIYHIDPQVKPSLTIIGEKTVWEQHVSLIKHLARIEKIFITSDPSQPKETAHIVSGTTSIFVHLGGLIDIEKERFRLTQEKVSVEKYKAGIEKRLNDKRFISQAPAHILEQNRVSLIEADVKISDLEKYLHSLVS